MVENYFFKFINLTSPFPARSLSSVIYDKKKKKFLISSEIYHIDTRQHANFHQPSVNLTKYQKGVYCLGGKVFNMLPSYIEMESDSPKKFKLFLQKFFNENSFYSLDEYFEL